MPDPSPQASNPPAAPAATTPPATPPAAPQGLKIVFNGQERVLTHDEAVRLAQIGLNDSTRRDQVLAQQQEYRAKQPLIRAAEELGSLAQQNPAAARAIAEAHTALRQGRATPEQVLAALSGQPQQQPQGESAPAPTSAGVDPQTRAMLAGLQAQVQALGEGLERQTVATTTRDLEATVRATLAQDPFLSVRSEALKRAQADAMSMIAQGRSVDEATLLASQGIRSLLSETATTERDRRLEGNEMRTVPVSAGIPPTKDFLPSSPDKTKARSPQEYMRNAWSETRAKARDYARAVQRAAVQGPGG